MNYPNQPNKQSMITAKITIFGKQFHILCPPDQEENLQRAARHLDRRMHEIRLKGSVIGSERIAIMAALNLANDLLSKEAAPKEDPKQTQRLGGMIDKIKTCLLADRVHATSAE